MGRRKRRDQIRNTERTITFLFIFSTLHRFAPTARRNEEKKRKRKRKKRPQRPDVRADSLADSPTRQLSQRGENCFTVCCATWACCASSTSVAQAAWPDRGTEGCRTSRVPEGPEGPLPRKGHRGRFSPRPGWQFAGVCGVN